MLRIMYNITTLNYRFKKCISASVHRIKKNHVKVIQPRRRRRRTHRRRYGRIYGHNQLINYPGARLLFVHTFNHSTAICIFHKISNMLQPTYTYVLDCTLCSTHGNRIRMHAQIQWPPRPMPSKPYHARSDVSDGSDASDASDASNAEGLGRRR